MNRSVVGLMLLVGILIGALWLWLARNHNIVIVPPIPAAHAQTEPALDTLTSERIATDRARAPAPSSTAAEVPQPSASTAPFALLKVRVVDAATHDPVAGAEVRAMFDDGQNGHSLVQTTRSHGKPFETLRSDQDGRAEIEIPPGVVSSVDANSGDGAFGFASVDVPPLEKDAVREVLVEVHVGRDLAFWLKFVDAETHDPIQGLSVTATKSDKNAQPVTSDAGGLALFQARSWQPSTLRIEGAGRSLRYVVTELGHARVDTPLVVEIPRSATLRVHVVDASGSGVASAAIDLSASTYYLYPPGSPPTWEGGDDPHWRAITDDAGRATLQDLPTRARIEAKVDGRVRWTAPEPLVLEPGEVRDVEWKIAGGCDVRGLLLDQKSLPIARHAIWLRKAERKIPILFESWSEKECTAAATDDQGRFHFPNVGSGAWWIGPADMSGKSGASDVAPFAQVVEIAAGQTDADVTLHVDRGLYIRGRVLDKSGQPVDSFYVSCGQPDTLLRADQNGYGSGGKFQLGPLMDGNYRVVANGNRGDRDSEPVMARAGEEDVVLQLRAGAAISGRVVGPDGKGVAGWAHLTNEDPKSPLVMNSSVNDDGEFKVEGLAPGVVQLSATTSNADIGYVDPIELTAGQTVKDVVIHVVPGGRVRVRHKGPEDYARISVMQRGLVLGVEYVSPGSTSELTAPAGSVLVRARYPGDDGRVVERSVEVKSGETVDVVFEKDAH